MCQATSANIAVRKPSSLANQIIAGSLIGINQIPYSIAMASIVFLGDLKPYFPQGIGLFLIGNAIVSANACWRSSSRLVSQQYKTAPLRSSL